MQGRKLMKDSEYRHRDGRPAGNCVFSIEVLAVIDDGEGAFREKLLPPFPFSVFDQRYYWIVSPVAQAAAHLLLKGCCLVLEEAPTPVSPD